jgi:hypothetical protein
MFVKSLTKEYLSTLKFSSGDKGFISNVEDINLGTVTLSSATGEATSSNVVAVSTTEAAVTKPDEVVYTGNEDSIDFSLYNPLINGAISTAENESDIANGKYAIYQNREDFNLNGTTISAIVLRKFIIRDSQTPDLVEAKWMTYKDGYFMILKDKTTNINNTTVLKVKYTALKDKYLQCFANDTDYTNTLKIQLSTSNEKIYGKQRSVLTMRMNGTIKFKYIQGIGQTIIDDREMTYFNYSGTEHGTKPTWLTIDVITYIKNSSNYIY